MKSETLQLLEQLDQERALEIARTLNAVNGVRKVSIATAPGAINIDFDDDLTSLQELRAVLHKTGFGVKKPAHGEDGVCCGSCGS